MGDLISRQSALDCFHDWIDSRGDVHTADEIPEYNAIMELPPAQPEIIHCKDCIKGKYHNLAKSTMCMLHPFNPVRVEPDGFCKWSERRTDD